MLARVNIIMRRIGAVVLASLAAICVLALSGIALVMMLVLAAPLKRLRTP